MNDARLVLRMVGLIFVGVGALCLAWMMVQPHALAVLGMTLGLVGLCATAISYVLPRSRIG